MADPVGFEGANFVFQAPPNTTPEECVDLSVCLTNEQIISCWRLTPEELKVVAETGVVWLSVAGQQMPMVCVAGTGLFTDGDPKAEPVMPRARRKV